ncbi:LCP family protein [Parasphingorhabdus pacifica]
MGKVFVAVLAILVLGSTGTAWAYLRHLSNSLGGNDVILSEPDGATDILLVGNDSRTDAEGNPLPEEVLQQLRTSDAEGGNLTDTMILVRVPNGGQRASAVSFPRDTEVQLGNGHGEHLLTEAMPREMAAARHRLEEQGVSDEKELHKRSREAGQRFLIKTIEQLSGVSIDHYAEVNLLGFHDVTKAIGGVEVCLNEPVNDPASGAVFEAGRQTVQGADALAFVRQRKGLPRGDLDRVVRQQVFLSGMAQKMLSGGVLSNPAKLSELMDALRKSVVLDEGWDVMDFARQMQGIAGGDIEFHTIPVELVGESGREDVEADPAEVRKFVDDLLLAPQERQAQQRPQQEMSDRVEHDPSDIQVSVYNTTGVSGLAGRVSDSLATGGFGTGSVGNASSASTSVVRYAPGEEASAKQVAAALGGIGTEQGEDVSAGTVEVYVADDYEGPGRRNFAAAGAVRLDGLRPAQPSSGAEDDERITAEGVPCVN